MDSLVLGIGVMQGQIMDWNVIWIGRGERVNPNHSMLHCVESVFLKYHPLYSYITFFYTCSFCDEQHC